MMTAFSAFGQTYDTAATLTEGSTYVLYSGEVDMSGAAEGSYYTQAIYVGDSNQGAGVLQVEIGDSTGTEDINVILETSHNRLSWSAYGTAVIDAATAGTTTASFDVISATEVAAFNGAIYVRFHFDGQTGNPAGVVDWSAYMPKNSGAPNAGVGAVANRRTS